MLKKTVDELIEETYVKSGMFYIDKDKTLRTKEGKWIKIVLSTNPVSSFGETIITFEKISSVNEWAVSCTYESKYGRTGALMGKRALDNALKIIDALNKQDGM